MKGLRILAGILLATAAAAAMSAENGCVTASDKLKERIAELSSPDATKRLATFNEMLMSCDLAQREVAYQRGFASSEVEIRALTLRAKLRDAKSLILQLTALPGNKASEYFVTRKGGNIRMSILSYDIETGEIRFGNSSGNRVSGTSLSFYYDRCEGVLKLGDGGVLQGTIGCANTQVRAEILL